MKEKIQKIFKEVYLYNITLQDAEKQVLNLFSVSGSAFTKDDLKKAFKAGETYTEDCKCGECHYCTETKDRDEPDFDDWFAEHYR